MYEDAGDVVGVLTGEIERLFDMRWDQLKDAVAAAPGVYPTATDVVTRHGDLIESQRALERAEDDLLAALQGTQAAPVDEATLGLAHRVNDAVAARDERAMAVTHLLDPSTAGTPGAAVDSRTRGHRRSPDAKLGTPAPRATSSGARSRRAAR
ncbi:hypothetical protein RM572_26460 [Streptomyces sp. DSM 42041]|uniref:Uncharacterized protein n=1 Tax=Streptomyces hazeniae TaxID=3075538 RepID=A0ABU2NZ94_9ACTN|nr:hypothetical protein [Streptomyces sp. DSM 42041]MDT0382306.1 hypothetical protein [Streptomyces sp. DSM 42041]